MWLYFALKAVDHLAHDDRDEMAALTQPASILPLASSCSRWLDVSSIEPSHVRNIMANSAERILERPSCYA